MPSVQGRLLRVVLRRVKLFGDKGMPIQELRRRVESGARLLRPLSGVSVRQVQLGNVPAEWLVPEGAPPDRVLLYFHGGGFVFCSLNTHRPLVSRLALSSGSRALSVDYRLAPEHPFPAALEDILTVYRLLLQNGIPPRKIVVAGDSAGGNLALVLLLALREAGDPLPAAAVCLSPVTDLSGAVQSRRTKAALDPVLRSDPSDLVSSYVGKHDPRQPLLSPLYANLHGLPPILLHVGEDEILLDDSTCLAERASAAGVDATAIVWPHMWHVFQAFAPFLPEARQSIEQMGTFVSEMQQK